MGIRNEAAQQAPQAALTGRRPLVQGGAKPANASTAAPELLLDRKASKPMGNIFKWVGFAVGSAKVKPDFSEQGFIAAAQLATNAAAAYNFECSADMCEEIAAQISASIRITEGVTVKFTATHKDTGFPRMVIRTAWGFRIAIDGRISFKPTVGSVTLATERRP